MTKQEFMKSLPIELPAFYKAYKQKRKIKDEEMWMMGQYVASAMRATVCNHKFWLGKNAKPYEYPKFPVLSDSSISASKDENNMSQEEKNKKIEELFLKLEIMGKNHKLTKEKEEKEKGGSQ